VQVNAVFVDPSAMRDQRKSDSASCRRLQDCPERPERAAFRGKSTIASPIVQRIARSSDVQTTDAAGDLSNQIPDYLPQRECDN